VSLIKSTVFSNWRMHNTFLPTTMNFCLSLTNNYQSLLQSKHPMNPLKREQQLNAVVLSVRNQHNTLSNERNASRSHLIMAVPA